MSNELKPCPFCQSRAEHYSFNYRKHTVRCRYCLADCGEHDTPERAAFVWNTRPAEDAKDKEIERLKAALEKIYHISFGNAPDKVKIEFIKTVVHGAVHKNANAPDTGKMEEK